MKVILFIPKMYSLAEMLFDGFEANGWEVKIADYKEMLPKQVSIFYERTVGLPNRITKYWKPSYYKEINKRYLDFIETENPDMILIYNNQYFFPETIKKIKKNSKVVFYLGDNPLWSKTFDHNLEILKYSDCTLSPDSYWMQELSSIGMPNVICDYIGYSSKTFSPVNKIPEKLKSKYQSDLLFIGRNYDDSSGYKRTLFMSSFEGFNFKIFGGKEWYRWLQYFPKLINNFRLLNSRITNEELNIAINCCKIYPIDQNTGIINGIHARLFEVIGSGTLPIIEWRKDIETFFEGLVPTSKNYNLNSALASKYLDDEDLRIETITKLKLLIDNNYTPKLFVNRFLDRLYN